MKKLVGTVAICVLALCAVGEARAQIYVKLNGLYACVGVINPQVEFRLSNHSSFQTEFVYSPWKSIAGGHPMHFGIFMNEYRYYIRRHNSGLYMGANVGMMAFNLSKPEFSHGHLRLRNGYSKGYGFMFGICIGYEYVFRERWVLDAYVGMAFMCSMYNGYSSDGVINMYPHRPAWKEPASPDPFNGSSEWLPNKLGLSIGYRIFKPKDKIDRHP